MGLYITTVGTDFYWFLAGKQYLSCNFLPLDIVKMFVSPPPTVERRVGSSVLSGCFLTVI